MGVAISENEVLLSCDEAEVVSAASAGALAPPRLSAGAPAFLGHSYSSSLFDDDCFRGCCASSVNE